MDPVTVFAALAHQGRQQILTALRNPERHFTPNGTGVDMTVTGVCVSQVSQYLDITPATASAFLAQLRAAGLLTSERIGKFTYYRRNERGIEEFTRTLRTEL
ncbi:Helix-turn-helix domain protein [Arthrobacter saudimassiliensis]|uniref:Helix-turn-helix domain protein n=1 Tax=Arthrobacter saudimassiliensis TaxID=1461584 RepID=A0A078MQS6_9MICC|nr:Helix-turn-helix domain protein [Arthrobacter saudimassiliensis]